MSTQEDSWNQLHDSVNSVVWQHLKMIEKLAYGKSGIPRLDAYEYVEREEISAALLMVADWFANTPMRVKREPPQLSLVK